jgi:CxxC motif-containing protein (DUF1111 family)
MGRRIESTRDGWLGVRSPAAVRARLAGVGVFGIVLGVWITGVTAADRDGSKAAEKVLAQGRELFEREWLPGDSRSHGGDGLGPVYNDSSCVACHNLGGSGGGGAASKNVDIITASPIGGVPVQFQTGLSPGGAVEDQKGFLAKALGSLVGLDTADGSSRPARRPAERVLLKSSTAAGVPARPKIDTSALVKTHPGFKTSRSVVLHRYGTDGDYESWRQTLLGFPGGVPQQVDRRFRNQFLAQNSLNMEQNQLQNRIGQFEVVRSQRNPTALYGAGVVDSIPEAVIEGASKAKHPGFPQVAGRVSRLKDKRIGRFGWKAQTASLEDFVFTACAVELGLEVPGHHQGGSPLKFEAKTKGLDLAQEECNSLAAYVRDLPRPKERTPATANEASAVKEGRALFAATGCATCHAPKLGEVQGMYSDLLLHDLGPQLGDVGQYSVFDPSSSEEEITDEAGPIASAAPDQPAEVAVAVPETAPAPPGGAGGAAFEAVAMSGMARVRIVGTGTGKRPTSGPASRFEWRTPPLWGFRDSGPYLHDGRAETLDQAVALHAGEAATITQNFFKLSIKERGQLEAFLKTLTAPAPPER